MAIWCDERLLLRAVDMLALCHHAEALWLNKTDEVAGIRFSWRSHKWKPLRRYIVEPGSRGKLQIDFSGY